MAEGGRQVDAKGKGEEGEAAEQTEEVLRAKIMFGPYKRCVESFVPAVCSLLLFKFTSFLFCFIYLKP